jgi:steroid delta-isomerase-like uncharacterized protein
VIGGTFTMASLGNFTRSGSTVNLTPDAAGTVTNFVASGNTAVLEVTWKGTHTGPLVTAAGTIPASGKHQETPAAVFYAFDGGKIKASRHYFDAMTLLKQIGAEPK